MISVTDGAIDPCRRGPIQEFLIEDPRRPNRPQVGVPVRQGNTLGIANGVFGQEIPGNQAFPVTPGAASFRPEHLKILSIFTDLFDYFFRYLADVLDVAGVLDEPSFWAGVAECIADYQRAHPELADRFARHDLFAPRFTLSCLNRLQLANNRQLIDLADPTRTLQFAGTLENPIASHRPDDLPVPGKRAEDHAAPVQDAVIEAH